MTGLTCRKNNKYVVKLNLTTAATGAVAACMHASVSKCVCRNGWLVAFGVAGYRLDGWMIGWQGKLTSTLSNYCLSLSICSYK